MWKPFIFENLHFAINVFGALAPFSIFWLYFDIWLHRKSLKEGFKVAGFLLLSLSFLAASTQIEVSQFSSSLFRGDLYPLAAIILRIFGYLLVGAGLGVENIGVGPKTKKETGAFWFLPVASLAQPILAAGVGW